MSDFNSITQNGLLCDSKGQISVSQFETAMRAQVECTAPTARVNRSIPIRKKAGELKVLQKFAAVRLYAAECPTLRAHCPGHRR